MKDIILDTLLDSVKLIPFLLLTYIFMEWLEHNTSNKLSDKVKNAGKKGPFWGGLLGVIPQCGFSAAASGLYAGGVINIGTLIAVFLSTSDEMLPIFISEAVSPITIIEILGTKVLIAIISGMIVETIYLVVLKQKDKDIDIHEVCGAEHCKCEDGILISAVKHTAKIFIYILLISFALNLLIGMIGEDSIGNVLSSVPVLGEALAALIGLIPNCASSVVITELYLSHVISSGAMMAGLLVNAGVGTLILFRLNRKLKQNFAIIGIMYALGVFWGVIIELIGIVF